MAMHRSQAAMPTRDRQGIATRHDRSTMPRTVTPNVAAGHGRRRRRRRRTTAHNDAPDASAAGRHRRLDRLRRRLPLAHLSGLPRHVRLGPVEPPRRAGQRRLRLHARHAADHREARSPRRWCARSTCRARRFATSCTTPTRPTAAKCPRTSRRRFPRSAQVLEALAIPVLECPGYEADDVLATIARHVRRGGRQLPARHRRQGLPATHHRSASPSTTSARTKCTTRRRSPADWGIAPEQVVDFQALVGDKVDNVPGVPLIGPKLAKELLEQVRHARKRARPRRRSARRQAEAEPHRLPRGGAAVAEARGARPPRAGRGRLASGPRRRVRRGARRRAVPRLRLPLARRPGAGSRRADRRRRQGRPAGARGGRRRWRRRLPRSSTRPKSSTCWCSQLEQQSQISIDTETTDISPRPAEIVGYAFAWKPGQAFYVPVRGPAGERVLDPVATADALRPILENPAIAKIGQNLKYDMIVLRARRHRAPRRRVRHDDRRLPARLRRAHAQPRPPRPQIPRPRDDQDRRGDRHRARTSSAWTRRPSPRSAATPPKTPTCRCGCCRSSQQRLAADGLARAQRRTSKRRSSRCSPTWNTSASASTSTGSAS